MDVIMNTERLSLLELLELPVIALAAVLAAANCAAPPAEPATATMTAQRLAVDLTTAWERHVITAGSPTGVRRGADGVDISGFAIATAWEEGGGVTLAHRPDDPLTATAWDTEQVATGLVGVEDARIADVDGDGVLDVVSASDSGQRVYVSFGSGTPGAYTTIDLLASHGHNHVMQVALADIDGDGNRDIVFGTRVGTAANPAIIGWLGNPGAAARDGNAWTYHQISLAGWAMSVLVEPGNRVVVSDRASYKDAGGVTRWDLYGARWLELVAGTWVNHAISPPAGSCSTCTPGDEMFLRVVDIDHDGQPDVVDCTSALGHANRVVIHRNLGGWASWSHTVIADVANVGHCQGVAVADLDGDGLVDIAASSWKGNTFPVPLADAARSGVWWLRNDGAGGWQRGEVSGPTGGKFDDVEVMDVDRDGLPDLVTSEQLDPAGGLGVIWYRNPGSP